MSEQEQHLDGEEKVTDHSSPQTEANDAGASIEIQRSGFDGERRDSEADELSPKAEASEWSLSRRVSRETNEATPPPPKKNSPTSFYRYLLVLFGAAFLMLLLAYFVQQRNSETAYSDLQNTMNLSRQELVEEIEALKAEKETLQRSLETAEQKQNSLAKQKEELESQLESFQEDWDYLRTHDNVLGKLAVLEQALRNGDYETAAQQVRLLAQEDVYLDLDISNQQGSAYFDARTRLTEVISLLERRGALEPGEVVLPTPQDSTTE